LTRAARRSLRSGAAVIVNDLTSQSSLWEVHGAIHKRIASVLANLVAAAAIESHADADKHFGEPVQKPLDDADAEHRQEGWWKHLLSSSGVNSKSIAARATATTSARDLAHIAIALRREAFAKGRYPATLPAIDGAPSDDPLTGGPRAYVVNADGSAELGSKTTLEVLRSIGSGLQLFNDSLYRWKLPAPR